MKNAAKKIFPLLVLSLILAFAIAGCAQPAASPTPTPSSTPTATTAPTVKPTSTPSSTPTSTPTATVKPTTTPAAVIKLNYNDWGTSRGMTKVQEWYMDELEKRSGGRIAINRYWSSTLGKDKDQLDNLKARVFDIGAFFAPYDIGKTPLSSFADLPFLTPGLETSALVTDELYKTTPQLQAEMNRWDVIYLYTVVNESYDLISTRPIRTIDDMKGMRVRATSNQAKAIKAMGGVPVVIGSTEIYTALQQGTIDANISPFASFGNYRSYEVAKYVTIINMGSALCGFVINKTLFNSFPADIQKIFMDLTNDTAKKNAELTQIEHDKWAQKFKEAGVIISELPAGERARAVAIGGAPVWEEWYKDMAARGLDGKAIVEKFQSLTRKYGG